MYVHVHVCCMCSFTGACTCACIVCMCAPVSKLLGMQVPLVMLATAVGICERETLMYSLAGVVKNQPIGIHLNHLNRRMPRPESLSGIQPSKNTHNLLTQPIRSPLTQPCRRMPSGRIKCWQAIILPGSPPGYTPPDNE